MGSDDDEIESGSADDDETNTSETSDDDEQGASQQSPTQPPSTENDAEGADADDDDDEQQRQENDALQGSRSDGERANEQAPAHDEEGDSEQDDDDEMMLELQDAFARIENEPVDPAPPTPPVSPSGQKNNFAGARAAAEARTAAADLSPKGPPAAIPRKLPPQVLPLPFDDEVWTNPVVVNHHHHHVYIWSPHEAVEEAASPGCHVIPTHGLRNHNLDYSQHRHVSIHVCKHLPMHVKLTHTYVDSLKPGHATMPCVRVASFVAGTRSAVHLERSTGRMHFTHQFVHYHCIHCKDMWAQSPGARSAVRRLKLRASSRVCVNEALVLTETKTATSCRPLGPVGEFVHHHTHFHTLRIRIDMESPDSEHHVL